MRLQSYNASFPVNKTISQLLLLYLILIIFTYPYGIEVTRDNYVRLPDLAALVIGGFALLCWFILGKSKLKLKPLFPILPFLFLELIFPILGAIYYGPISVSLSSARVLLLYLPVTICIFRLSAVSGLKLDLKLEKLLKIALITNVIYCIIQLAVSIGIMPESWLITKSLEAFAADEHFAQTSSFRVSGFFVNMSALASFAIVAMSYFLAKFQVKSDRRYLTYIMLALLLVMFSTSRSAYMVASLILFFCLLTSKFNKSLKILLTIILSVFFLLLVLSFYLEIDYDIFFSRFIRIQEQGLEQDYSWSTRVEEVWPLVLYKLQKYPWGTFIPSFKILGIIDSGYLTYYAQGKWIFITGFIGSLAWIFCACFRVEKSQTNWAVFFLRYLLIYISLAMVVTNPMRSPLVIFALLYGLWFLSIDEKKQYFKNSASSRFLYKNNSLSRAKGQ